MHNNERIAPTFAFPKPSVNISVFDVITTVYVPKIALRNLAVMTLQLTILRILRWTLLASMNLLWPPKLLLCLELPFDARIRLNH